MQDQRVQAYYQDDRYSRGGPKSDEECIQSLGSCHVSLHAYTYMQSSASGTYRKSKTFHTIMQTSPEEYFQEDHTYWVPADNEEDLYCQFSQCKYREILRKYIRSVSIQVSYIPICIVLHIISSYYLIPCRLGEELGSGHFGSVQKGIWKTREGPTEVAVKTLKAGLSERERVKFLQEAAIMGQFSHPNIVQLHGVVTVGEPVSVSQCLLCFKLHVHVVV